MIDYKEAKHLIYVDILADVQSEDIEIIESNPNRVVIDNLYSGVTYYWNSMYPKIITDSEGNEYDLTQCPCYQTNK